MLRTHFDKMTGRWYCGLGRVLDVNASRWVYTADWSLNSKFALDFVWGMGVCLF